MLKFNIPTSSRTVLLLMLLGSFMEYAQSWSVTPKTISPSLIISYRSVLSKSDTDIIYSSSLSSSALSFSASNYNNNNNEEEKSSSFPRQNNDQQQQQQEQQWNAQQQQEAMFESMALNGSESIAKMDIPERAKRAMLAEALEDRIFELTETLEGFVDGTSGMISEEDREEAVELAKQTKTLQIQYNDLVSGKQSSILDSFNAIRAGGGGSGGPSSSSSSSSPSEYE